MDRRESSGFEGQEKLTALSSDAAAIVEWLADVGVRWGLPADACRVHGLLYLLCRPLPADAIETELSMTAAAVEDALGWLVEEQLVQRDHEGWTTEADPWRLLMRTLERRREQELTPALSILGPWRHGDHVGDPVVARQARRLLELVDDIAAIDAGTRRFSPRTLRRVIGIGGRAARLFEGRSRGRGKR